MNKILSRPLPFKKPTAPESGAIFVKIFFLEVKRKKPSYIMNIQKHKQIFLIV